MSTLSFGFPALAPSTTEEAWFPRLETDDRHVVQEMEDGLQRELERLRHYPFPKFVGEQVPDEEDEDPVDEDDDQEEKAREPPDAAGAGVVVLDVEDHIGGDHQEETEEEGELEEDAEEIMSEEEAFTGDEDMDMEGEDGMLHGSDGFDVYAEQVTDSADDSFGM